MLIGTLQSGWAWLSGSLLASVVAGAATDPFALMHFQRFALYGVPTNLIATPITSLILGPAAIAGAVLSVFGEGEWAWRVMGDALDFLIAAAGVFADRPEAVRYLPRPPEAAFLLWTFAVTWACLWRGPLRLGALAPLALGLALYAFSPRPAVWLDGRGEAVVMRATTEEGPRWFAMYERAGDFEAERIGQLAGLSPQEVARVPSLEACTSAICTWRTPEGRNGALVLTADGFTTACARNAIVVARLAPPADWRAQCQPSALVGPNELTANGGASITEIERGVETRFALASRAQPWTRTTG